MKRSDIPAHVTELDPPWFYQEVHKKYNIKDNIEGTVPLYHIDFHDGPLSGMIRVANKYFYAESVYGEERKWWAAWELTEDELTRELARHKLFELHVGTHTNYVKNEEDIWVRAPHELKERTEWDRFYKDPAVPKIDYDEVKKRDFVGILMNPFWEW